MADLKQVRISGFGGQGVVLAGMILGHAAIDDGKWVSGSNSYGAQARGGSASSEVVISDEPIKFPHVIRSDILVALSQSAYDKFSGKISKDGAIVIYDDLLVKPSEITGVRQVGFPATDRAIAELDNKQAANIVILGASVAMTGIVSRKALETAVSKSIEHRFKALNLKALEVGYNLGEQAKNG
jgi:2-oxoglutarate ferredoxin oxidoreductase subunit gamma